MTDITLEKRPGKSKEILPYCNPAHRVAIQNHLQSLPLVEDSKRIRYRVTIEEIKTTRSLEQNRLQMLWIKEAAEQLGDERAEDKRAYCKLHFGVPILRFEEDDFREQYDATVKPMDYETKLLLMKSPIDFPVTRLMKIGQMSRYLTDVEQYLRGLGCVLTDPETYGEVRAA